jgi:ATP-binding cassette subfamily G (WHITE) protein 2 (PDR)
MASNGPLYLPIRTGDAEPVDEDRVEPSTTVPSSSDSSNVEGEIQDDQPQPLRRTSTTRSVREREFQPIAAGDRDELYRIASNFASGSLTRTSTKASGLERRDTLYNVNIGDPVLDPSSPEFDPYKWSRMCVQIPFFYDYHSGLEEDKIVRDRER